MSEKQVLAHATVRVVVRVKLSQPWPGDVTAEQLFEAAGREAKEKVACALQYNGAELAVEGEPRVTMVIGERER